MTAPAIPGAHAPATTPSVGAAAAVFVAYCVVVLSLMKLSGVSYEHFFDTTTTTLRSAVLPLAAGTALLVAVLWKTRWRVMHDEGARLRMGFLWALPTFAVLTIVLQLAGLSWGKLTPGQVGAVLLASVLVGFTEETLFRGIILTALRGRLRTEAAAAGVTTVWFGLFHLTNLALGEPGAVLQVGFATLTGLGFYLARRGTGILIAAMILHGAWDFAAFLVGVAPNEDGALAQAGAFCIALIYPLAAISFVVLLVRDRNTPARAPAEQGSAETS